MKKAFLYATNSFILCMHVFIFVCIYCKEKGSYWGMELKGWNIHRSLIEILASKTLRRPYAQLSDSIVTFRNPFSLPRPFSSFQLWPPPLHYPPLLPTLLSYTPLFKYAAPKFYHHKTISSNNHLTPLFLQPPFASFPPSSLNPWSPLPPPFPTSPYHLFPSPSTCIAWQLIKQ